MRKLEQRMLHLLYWRNEGVCSPNTKVRRGGWRDPMLVLLHGNVIARIPHPYSDEAREDLIYITNAGWPTSTTRSRLNALLSKYGGGRVFRKDGKDFVEVDGEVREMKDGAWYGIRRP